MVRPLATGGRRAGRLDKTADEEACRETPAQSASAFHERRRHRRLAQRRRPAATAHRRGQSMAGDGCATSRAGPARRSGRYRPARSRPSRGASPATVGPQGNTRPRPSFFLDRENAPRENANFIHPASHAVASARKTRIVACAAVRNAPPDRCPETADSRRNLRPGCTRTASPRYE